MKKPTLLEGLLVAVGLCFIAVSLKTLFFTGFGFFYTGVHAWLAVVSLLYIFYLLSRAPQRVGKFTMGCLVSGVLLGSIFLSLQGPFVFLIATALIWMVRTVFFSQLNLSESFFDALLCLLSLGWTVCALVMTSSMIWAIWIFFLSQALFVLLPQRKPAHPAAHPAPSFFHTDGTHSNDGDIAFSRAHSAAQAALKKLAI